VSAVLLLLLAQDWAQWRGPKADGGWDAPELPEKWPAGGLKTLWRVPVHGGYAGIAVAGGRVYTMDREAAPSDGKQDGHERALCVDAADGKALWTHRYPALYGDLTGYSNGPRAMPVVHDGRVYTLGAMGRLLCFEAATGTILWSKDMVAEHRARVPTWGFAASPLVDGDRVLVHTAAEPGGSLIAFDRKTGAEVWRALPDEAGYCTPAIYETKAGRLLVLWTPQNIRGLDPATGKLRWTVPYKVTYGVAITSPIFHEDLVFVTGYWEGSKAVRTDGTLVWEDARLRGVMMQPLYRDGYAYSMDNRSGLVCFEFKTGKRMWDDHALTAKGRNPHAVMTWLGGGPRALLLNAEGDLILARLTPEGYDERSRVRAIEGRVWGHPAFSGKHMFVKSDGAEKWSTQGELACIRLAE
jgi:outer membrane protein assembly factor BamB